MAKIPVEKKGGGTSIWPWILGALLLIGLIWLLFYLLGDGEDAIDEQTTEMVEGTGVAGGTITSMAALREAQGRNAIVGRDVDLTNMRVESVVGDSSFFVTPANGGAGEQLLVVLQGLGETGNGEYNVNEGNMVDVQGTIEQFTQQVGQQSGVTGADAERALSDGIYLNANELNVREQPPS